MAVQTATKLDDVSSDVTLAWMHTVLSTAAMHGNFRELAVFIGQKFTFDATELIEKYADAEQASLSLIRPSAQVHSAEFSSPSVPAGAPCPPQAIPVSVQERMGVRVAALLEEASGNPGLVSTTSAGAVELAPGTSGAGETRGGSAPVSATVSHASVSVPVPVNPPATGELGAATSGSAAGTSAGHAQGVWPRREHPQGPRWWVWPKRILLNPQRTRLLVATSPPPYFLWTPLLAWINLRQIVAPQVPRPPPARRAQVLHSIPQGPFYRFSIPLPVP